MAAINNSIYAIGPKNLILNSAKDVESIIAEMNQIDNLTEVIFSGNTIGIEAGKALATALKNKISLHKAIFSDMFTTRLREEIPPVLDALVEALEDKEHLQEIDLSDNAFGPAGAKPLMRLLANNRNIQILKLNNNGLGTEGSRMIATALLEAQEKNIKDGKPSNLRVFIAGRNRLESKGAEQLSKAFAAHKLLREVRMPANGIRPEGVEILVSALASCTELEWLDLQDNTFTEIGSLALAKVLPFFTNLRVLNIGDCLLGATGSAEIITALASGHTALERLNMIFGEIDNHAVQLIPNMINNKVMLTSLELNGNAFDPASQVVQNIRDILRSHGFSDALDELDEMDYEDDDDEENDVSKEEEDEESGIVEGDDEDTDVNELAAQLGKKLEIQ